LTPNSIRARGSAPLQTLNFLGTRMNAEDKRTGIMEWWNNGTMGNAVDILFLKSRHSIPQHSIIPVFHHSSIPSFQYSIIPFIL